MTRLDPSLLVNRLLVERGTTAVYDEKFHAGVNIIRGANSSGKSTVLNFLFHALGGDLTDWSEVARLCTRVTVEVSFNGKIATLSRDVSTEARQPMDIFGGPMSAALTAPRAEWTRYPYLRSTSRESFSQAIFRLLQVPEVGNDASGNITIHQVLRLLYADQLSPIERIFKFEGFDAPTTRAAIGRLICGAYDNQMYENELRIRELTKQFDGASAELRSLLAVLGKAQEGMTLSWITAQRQILLARQTALRQEIEQAERQVFAAAKDDQLSLRAQESAYAEVQAHQARIGQLEERQDALSLTIADSRAFISGLEQKLTALNDADLVAEHLGDVQFQSCPACFAPIDGGITKHACHLCKTPFDTERVRERIVSLINDTALQLRQSRTLQTRRETDIRTIAEELTAARETWRAASNRLAEARRLPSSEVQETLRALHRQSGYLEREIEDLENKASIIQLVEELSKRKADLNAAITQLRDDNAARQTEQEKRLAIAYTAIADEVIKLLHGDLRREASFEQAKSIQFDFGDNYITVDGVSYFSASSRAILKSSFFVSLLVAALKHPFFRHPRFVMLDTIEDKGMEPARSQNLQRMIAAISKGSPVQHQIIFATAMIAPELDVPEYTVGRASTRDDHTLKISS
jgi:hypothetical protein